MRKPNPQAKKIIDLLSIELSNNRQRSGQASTDAQAFLYATRAEMITEILKKIKSELEIKI